MQGLDRAAASRILTLDPIDWAWTALPLMSDQAPSWRSDGQSEYGSSSVGTSRALPVVATSPVRNRPALSPARPAAQVQVQTSTNKQPTAKSPIAPPTPMKRKDPHPHPTPAPAPASALSIYILSHRYGIQALQDEVIAHLLFTLDADNCMPLLFATFHYEEKYMDILNFVVDNWRAVKVSPEFLNCIQQVSAGLWGEDGGLVLHDLFRQL